MNTIGESTGKSSVAYSYKELSNAKIIKFYSLRFQIEFNFRDAKQYWSSKDFMNAKETVVTNAANL